MERDFLPCGIYTLISPQYWQCIFTVSCRVLSTSCNPWQIICFIEKIHWDFWMWRPKLVPTKNKPVTSFLTFMFKPRKVTSQHLYIVPIYKYYCGCRKLQYLPVNAFVIAMTETSNAYWVKHCFSACFLKICMLLSFNLFLNLEHCFTSGFLVLDSSLEVCGASALPYSVWLVRHGLHSVTLLAERTACPFSYEKEELGKKQQELISGRFSPFEFSPTFVKSKLMWNCWVLEKVCISGSSHGLPKWRNLLASLDYSINVEKKRSVCSYLRHIEELS